MRFLCLHGMGTNAKIFENETALIRQALGRGYEFIFIDGTIQTDPAPGYNSIVNEPLRFSTDNDAEQNRVLYHDMINLIKAQGPFDGLMGFSEGGGVAATLLVEDSRRPFAGFKCAIFFCASPALDPDQIRTGVQRNISHEIDGVVVNIPTAHIWSKGGNIWPDMGQSVVPLCQEKLREEFIHRLGHTIPGAHSAEGLKDTVRIIERTIEKSKEN